MIVQFIQSATSQKSHDLSIIIRSISIRVSDVQYLRFCNNLWWTDCQKVCPTYPSTYRYGANPPPSNLQWTQIRVFQTRTRTRNPGLTFPKPENPGLQKEPGFGNSNRNELLIQIRWRLIVQDSVCHERQLKLTRSGRRSQCSIASASEVWGR